MKLLVILFSLKLYASISIFKHIEMKYGQNEVELARVMQKQRSRITKIQCDIKYSLSYKQNSLIPLFARPNSLIKIK